MESKDIKKLVVDNKEKILDYHKRFFEAIEKIKGYETLTKELILNSEKFFDDKGNFNKSAFFNFLLTHLLASKLNGFSDILNNS